MMKSIVAVVGRPNVGKSTLFNRLIEERLAIIENIPGVTRDRLYAECEWNGRTFTMVDTGGIQVAGEETIEGKVTKQAEIAMKEADVIIFVVDVTQGVTLQDEEVAMLLRRVKKPVLLCVNKVDNLKRETDALEFYSLGIPDLISVSAVHGMGTGDLLDAITERLPAEVPEVQDDDEVRVAVIGRPNVGKSSLVNAILGEERVIVSEIAGTTRDAIDVAVEQDGRRYILIDTAGMRKRRKIDEPVEKYSVMRSLRAVDRAQVVLLVIDAQDGVTDQDQRIAGYANEQGKACVVVMNKYDLIEKDDKTMQKMSEDVRERLAFMQYYDIAFLSAKTHSRLNKLLPQVLKVWENHGRKLNTRVLNDLIKEAILVNPPASDQGRRLKVYYTTQTFVHPPQVTFFCNDPQIVHFSYKRYLENRIREAFDLSGTPLWLKFRMRTKVTLSKVGKGIVTTRHRSLKEIARKAREAQDRDIFEDEED